LALITFRCLHNIAWVNIPKTQGNFVLSFFIFT